MSLERIFTGKPFEKGVRHCPGIVTSGRLLHTSGITPRDDDGNLVGRDDMRAQIVQVFRNLGDVLAAAGTDFSRVVKYTVFVSDMEAFRRERAIDDDIVTGPPASTLIGVARLGNPDWLIEVEAVAEID